MHHANGCEAAIEAVHGLKAHYHIPSHGGVILLLSQESAWENTARFLPAKDSQWRYSLSKNEALQRNEPVCSIFPELKLPVTGSYTPLPCHHQARKYLNRAHQDQATPELRKSDRQHVTIQNGSLIDRQPEEILCWLPGKAVSIPYPPDRTPQLV